MNSAASIDPPIAGFCDSAFAAARDAFRENFRARNELGAAVCVFVDGRMVVDLWGGHQDGERTRPWQHDTLVNVYSVGKGIASMFVLSLVEQGLLALDRPLCEIWPGIAQAGKQHITLRMLLAHRGGLPGVRHPLPPEALWDWSTITNALAGQEPFWEPGSAHGYHVNTHGFLIGEPVCRRLGAPFGSALRERLTGPLGADCHVGLPLAEHARVAPIAQGAAGPITDAQAGVREHLSSGDEATDAMLASVYFNPLGISGFGVVNLPQWRSATIPSTNAHATARAVALLYDTFMRRDAADGGIVGPGLRTEASSIQSDGTDRVLGKHSRFGLGFQLSRPGRRIGGSDHGYGHFGYGGSLGFADPASGVAFAYLTNRPGKRFENERADALITSVYAAFGDTR
ncbi:MAG TPA: serine hydrolase domain-containing protein [Pseudomonadales bacterium]|nr:serine hydrolase domain-containing protein [Pseudomonadales bacterium]